MLGFFLTRPVTALLTLAGAALLAPVLLPLTAVIVKPLIKPMTNFYLDLADEVAEAIEEREASRKTKGAAGKRAAAPQKPRTQELTKAAEKAFESEAAAAIVEGVTKVL